MSPDYEIPSFSVLQLGNFLKDGLNNLFPQDFWIEGQISNFRIVPKSGHAYFDLIDPISEQGSQPMGKFSVALWNSQRSEIDRTLQNKSELILANDINVKILAHLDFWPPGGRLQLIMRDVDPQFTFGHLAQEKEKLLQNLKTEGLTERNKLHIISKPALNIALITSIGSAAYADFCDELLNSNFSFNVLARDTRMQGEGSASDIEEGLKIVTSYQPDVIAIIRGGGSTSDLLSFDSESLARAIANSSIPIFTGIGHEIDQSVADVVAHTSYKTPTACAVGLVETVNEFIEKILAIKTAVINLSHNKISLAQSHHSNLYSRTVTIAKTSLFNSNENLKGVKERISVIVPNIIKRNGDKLHGFEDQIRALDPKRLLARGWSITRTQNGEIISSTNNLFKGDEIETIFEDGTVKSTINEVVI
ncbi:MAG: exodeoxyribonuclease VII large subunit [Acidimicrobiaceae bacterium]|jgi:exodeoxyribonuclease VII large subunit|nr:exodeoxyribonuclease VII large subunit [Acidimicrobiaceae bacterium]HJO41622.1 exodeoxyribonuclease VII large subunit [Acidimicrobiales bacterium]|tara:strand:+ start:321 stop:1580 length:1260 start_codon:yes stop_codon:yes gene_type:complete